MIYHNKYKSREPLKGKKAHSNISKIIKGRQPAPMTSLKWNEDGPVGQLKGPATTNPKEIEHILKGVWGKIFDGDERDIKEVATKFENNYKHIFSKNKEFELGDFTVDDFKAACKPSSESAAS